MEVRNQITPVAAPKRLAIVAAIAITCAGFTAPAFADGTEEVLTVLHAKGILSDAEYESLIKKIRSDNKTQALVDAKKEEDVTKALKPANDALVGKFDNGFKLESGDKQNSIALKGRIQADYRNYNVSSGTINGAASANTADTFDVRRAYIGIAGKWQGDWNYEIVTDVAQGAAPQLDTGWIEYAAFPFAKVRVGQFTMPFSLEEITSDTNVDFQERSLADFLVPSKERGLMVHGTITPGVYYALASSNGQGKNTNEPNSAQDGKDFIARGVVNIAELVENKDAIFHLGAGYTKGTGSVAGITGVLNNNASTARTEGRGLNFFTMTLPNGPTATAGAASFINGQEFDRERTGLEGVLAYNQFKLQTEWEKLNISGTSAPNNPGGALAYDRDIKAHYVTATWLITGEKYSNFYKDGAFGAIKPANNFKTTGVGIGAWEVGVRYSSFDAGDFNNAATNPAGTGQAAGLCNTPALLAAGTTAGTCLTNGADAWTYGLKWVPTPNFLLELNYVRTKFDTPVSVITGNVNGTTTSENAVTFRGGLTF